MKPTWNARGLCGNEAPALFQQRKWMRREQEWKWKCDFHYVKRGDCDLNTFYSAVWLFCYYYDYANNAAAAAMLLASLNFLCSCNSSGGNRNACELRLEDFTCELWIWTSLVHLQSGSAWTLSSVYFAKMERVLQDVVLFWSARNKRWSGITHDV